MKNDHCYLPNLVLCMANYNNLYNFPVLLDIRAIHVTCRRVIDGRLVMKQAMQRFSHNIVSFMMLIDAEYPVLTIRQKNLLLLY